MPSNRLLLLVMKTSILLGNAPLEENQALHMRDSREQCKRLKAQLEHLFPGIKTCQSIYLRHTINRFEEQGPFYELELTCYNTCPEAVELKSRILDNFPNKWMD